MTKKERIERIKAILQGITVSPLHFRSKRPERTASAKWNGKPFVSDSARIESLVVENAGQSFNGNDFRDLLRPGVYVAMLEESPLYVGMSNQLLRRVGGKHRQADRASFDARTVCKSLNIQELLVYTLLGTPSRIVRAPL